MLALLQYQNAEDILEQVGRRVVSIGVNFELARDVCPSNISTIEWENQLRSQAS
jgi:hypothetical protein